MSTNQLDYTSCDKEKIHLITSVQGHGAFLAVNRVDLKIRNVSENLSSYFGHNDESKSFIGKRLNDLFSMELTTKLLAKIRTDKPLPDNFSFRHDKGNLDIHIFQIAEDLAGIEVEFFEETDDIDLSAELNRTIEDMQKAPTLRQVSELACKAVRFLSGFERVMIYRFFPPTMYGEVIAEDRVAGAQSFLNHRFPATDIPKPARDLYLRNKVRYIHDSAGENFPIYPQVYDKRLPLDMSDSRLRSVSLIHLEYLKNMGVRGSMSVAIIVGGHLWGIISCHHSTPSYVSQQRRRLCLQVANTLAMVAPLMENVVTYSQENGFYSRLHEFFNEIKLEPDPLGSIFRKGDQVNALFDCAGVGYVTPDKVTTSGLTPRSSEMRGLWEDLRKTMTGDVFVTENLSGVDKKFESIKDQASGVLAIKVSPSDDSMLIFLRPESLQSILWGGDPRKNLQERQYNGQINPRASFETWTEVVKGTSVPWNEFEMKGARQFRNLVFDSLVRKEQLIEELHGRLKAKS